MSYSKHFNTLAPSLLLLRNGKIIGH